jgi:hypothetical protein
MDSLALDKLSELMEPASGSRDVKIGLKNGPVFTGLSSPPPESGRRAISSSSLVEEKS